MSNSNPVVNLGSPLVNPATGIIAQPWQSFFQQSVQKPPPFEDIVIGVSPFSYTPNVLGHCFVDGGTITAILLERGQDSINFTGDRLIPMSIGDTLVIIYTVLPTLKFIQR